ncbi:MAG: DUF1573 domain-containing protein [Muribaculum sp.]|nr:DUF1573 domain-containing protein [Muribaculaceae bacterium]MCM1081130.1 DUF1573 domain-containing protein [Muribaculum sp.]
MRLKLIMLAIIGSALIVSAQTDSISPADGGFLKLKEATIDLGSISGDSIVTARFTVYNTGTQPVEIIRIFSSCSCTVPTFTRQPIQPGDSTQFDVSYDPRGYRWGQFRRTLRIRSTATNKFLTAIIKGSIARKYKR